jgi:hypothetical protein
MGTCGQWPSTAQGDVAAVEKAKLPAQIEWSGAGSNCRPSAFRAESVARRRARCADQSQLPLTFLQARAFPPEVCKPSARPT